MNTTRFHSLVAMLVLGTTAVHAQSANSWVGRRVFTKHGAVLRVGNQVVDDEQRRTSPSTGRESRAMRVYTVAQTKGPWMWLVDTSGQGARGWVTTDWVVPLDRAIDYFTAEIRTNPKDSGAYTSRGTAWDELKEYDKAIADYTEAVRLDPHNVAAHVCRAVSYILKGEYDKAITDCTEAIHLDPSFVSAYDVRGFALDTKKDHDKAIADFTEAIRLDPKNAVAYNNRGAAWNCKKDYDKAIGDCTVAIRLNPSQASAYLNLGNAWDARRKYDKAIDAYTQAIRLDPRNALAYKNRGMTWHTMGNYRRAIADFNEALRLDPKNASVYELRAWLLATCPDKSFRDGKQAVESATLACDLSSWRTASCIRSLAAAYAEVGNFEAAVKTQKRAIDLLPDDESKDRYGARLRLYEQEIAP